MDEMVKAAMAKWPNVPDCFGWLGLDARGDWYMRDSYAQSAGEFQAACHAPVRHPAKGSRLAHEGLIAFIGRNYARDETGRWYFQNGPQRVFVELAATPWVWTLAQSGKVLSHTGVQAYQINDCLLDENGHLYLDTELGLGQVHTLDVPLASDWIEQGLWKPVDCAASEMPQRFGYVVSPSGQQKWP